MKREKIIGIYRIVCVKNGRFYYGSSKDIWYRWQRHLSDLHRHCHSNQILQRCFDKYGERSLRIELVEQIPLPNLRDVEQKYLNEHFGKPNCMNLAPITNNALFGLWLGKTHSEESKQKMQIAATGRKLSEETRQKIAESNRGRPSSLKGKPWSTARRTAQNNRKKLGGGNS